MEFQKDSTQSQLRVKRQAKLPTRQIHTFCNSYDSQIPAHISSPPPFCFYPDGTVPRGSVMDSSVPASASPAVGVDSHPINEAALTAEPDSYATSLGAWPAWDEALLQHVICSECSEGAQDVLCAANQLYNRCLLLYFLAPSSSHSMHPYLLWILPGDLATAQPHMSNMPTKRQRNTRLSFRPLPSRHVLFHPGQPWARRG